MRRRLEEESRAEGGLALAHQAIDEGAGVRDAADPREDDCPGRRYPFQVRSRPEEGIGERLVTGEEVTGSRREAVEALEGEGCQAFGDDRATAVDHVARTAHPIRKRRRSDDPTGPQARESLRLGQAARRYEPIPPCRRPP